MRFSSEILNLRLDLSRFQGLYFGRNVSKRTMRKNGVQPMKIAAVLLACLFFLPSCKQGDVAASSISETAQNVGDVMASIDEASGNNTGTIALNEQSELAPFSQYAEGKSTRTESLLRLTVPAARAEVCGASSFATCDSANHTVTRNFNGCTVGVAVFSGTVQVKWGGASVSGCTIGVGTGSYISRVPDYTVTGLRGANLRVSSAGSYGQKLTYVSGATPNWQMDFTSDGIRRKFTDSNGTVLYDTLTSTTSAMRISGNNRLNRTLSGGVLRVKDNLNSVTCDFIPTNVTWADGSCNCPSQGSWSASCSDGSSSVLTLKGCGVADYTSGSDVQSVNFDRCVQEAINSVDRLGDSR